MSNFKGLLIYQRSYRAAIEVYRMTENFPKEELYGLTSQMKRASTSVPLNIAEGHGKRESTAEFKRFLLMAIGSCDEMRVLLDMSKDLGYIPEDRYSMLEKEYDEIGKMINKFRMNVR